MTIRIRFIIIIFFITFCINLNIFCSENIDSTLSQCKTCNTTQDNIVCLNKAYQEWDNKLNEKYNELKSLLTVKEINALKASQLKWIAFRDAEYDFINFSYTTMEGTIYKLYLLENKIELTKSRAMQFMRYINEIKESKGGI